MQDQQLLRYSRQIMLPEVEIAGQHALLGARVLIVGMGGLGSPAALYCAAAGIGTLALTDFDTVDLSNLQRQIIHRHSSIGQPKVISAAATLRELNAECQLITLPEKLEGDALREQVRLADVVLDCSDRFTTRFAINAACIAEKTPLVSGAAIQFGGQLAVFDPRRADSPCYHCLYDDHDDEGLRCAESGVISPLVGVIGSLQALEAVKLISGAGQAAVGQLLIFDALQTQWRRMQLSKDPSCPSCATA